MPRTTLTAARLRAALTRRGMSVRTSPDGTALASVSKNGTRRTATLAEVADVINEEQRRLDAASPCPSPVGDLDRALSVLARHARTAGDPTLALAARALREAAAASPEAAAAASRVFADHLHPVVRPKRP